MYTFQCLTGKSDNNNASDDSCQELVFSKIIRKLYVYSITCCNISQYSFRHIVIINIMYVASYHIYYTLIYNLYPYFQICFIVKLMCVCACVRAYVHTWHVMCMHLCMCVCSESCFNTTINLLYRFSTILPLWRIWSVTAV